MKLSERFRPATLADVVGQPCLSPVHHWLQRPHSRCFLFAGPPGCGKTSGAYALAADLGCADEWSGQLAFPSTDLGIDECRKLFTHTLRFRPLEGSGWRVVIIEELERVASPAVKDYLKTALEQMLPAKCVVVATSNDFSGLEPALVQRFTVCQFEARKRFADAACERIEALWNFYFGTPMPIGWRAVGWRDGDFSVRLVWDHLEQFVPCYLEQAG